MSVHNEPSPIRELVERHHQYIQQASQPSCSSSLSKRASGTLVHFSELEATKMSGMPPLIVSKPQPASSSDHPETTPRGSRISPRHIFSIFSPRSSSGSLKSSPRNTLNLSHGESSQRLNQCNPLEGALAEEFDQKLRIMLRNSIKKFASQTLIKCTKSRIFHIIDTHLEVEYAGDANGERSSNSPRSDKALEEIHKEIKSSKGLTSDLILRLEKIRSLATEFLLSQSKKTPWSIDLDATLDRLLKTGGDPHLFTMEYRSITDKKMKQIIQSVIGTGEERRHFWRKIKKWNGDTVPKNLKSKFALVNLGYIDLLKIPQQRLIFNEENFALIDQSFCTKFCRILSDMHLLTINGESFPLYPYRAGQMDERRFLYYFLVSLNKAGGRAINENALQEEVNTILMGSGTVPSKILLCSCILPWNKFAKKIDQIVKPLQPHIRAVPDEMGASLSIEASPNGYRITKVISYDFYHMPPESSQGTRIGTVQFYWTLSVDPSQYRNCDWLRWQGCIQILEIPTVEKQIPYEIKWAFLNKMINFSTISEPASLQYISLTEDPHQVQKYIEEMVTQLDRPQTILNGDHISWYTLEMHVKNTLRETLYQLETECEFRKFAELVWVSMVKDGKILQPMINRLQLFREKLLDFALDQSIRIPVLEEVFLYIDMLITNKDLGVFVDLITGGLKNKSLHQLIINNVFGGYKIALNLRVNSEPQRQHIQAIIDRLKVFIKGPEFLYPALLEIKETSHHHDRTTIISTPHQWNFSPAKIASTRNTPLFDIARSFIHEKKYLYNRVVVNGVDLHEGLHVVGTKPEIQTAYFTRLLHAIYEKFDPSVTSEEIAKQVEYLVPPDGAVKEVTVTEIPCLPLLQLCAVNQAQNGTRFYKTLFDLHHAPFTTNDLQDKECIITVESAQDYSVELLYQNGIYARELPEELEYTTSNTSRLLATIPISWKVFSYTDEGSEKILGTLHITENFTCHPIANAEEVHLIHSRLFDYNRGIESRLEGNIQPSQSLKSPLALDLPIPTRSTVAPAPASSHHPTSPILSLFSKSRK
jgi:hypothetical protein